MRRALDKRAPAYAWAIFALLLAGLLYVLYRHPYATWAFIIAVALGDWYSKFHYRKRFTEMAEGRKSESICEFVKAFDPRTTDTWIIRAVYEELQAAIVPYGVRLPIRPDDNLSKLLAFDSDALDFDVAPRIAERTGRSLHGAKANPHFGAVETAAELVCFFNEQPVVVTNEALLLSGVEAAGDSIDAELIG
jgi:hypothetical protein